MAHCVGFWIKDPKVPAHVRAKADFKVIDDEMAKYFEETPDPKQWFRGWYNVIAMALAAEMSWRKIEKMLADDGRDDLLEVCHYLKWKYEVRTWREW